MDVGDAEAVSVGAGSVGVGSDGVVWVAEVASLGVVEPDSVEEHPTTRKKAASRPRSLMPDRLVKFMQRVRHLLVGPDCRSEDLLHLAEFDFYDIAAKLAVPRSLASD